LFMMRRLIVLLAAGGAIYFVYTRFFRSPPVLVDDDWDLDFDSPPPPTPVSAAPADAPEAETDTASTEPERIRALVGSDGAETAVEDAPTDEAAASETMIRGNVRDDGEKIYHMPGDPTYSRTKAEQLFATAEEAEAAGFRRAGRPRES
jgi:hypothetical protein